MSPLSPAILKSMHEWLSTKAALENLSVHTVSAYERDLLDYLGFMSAHLNNGQAVKSLAYTRWRFTCLDGRAAQKRAEQSFNRQKAFFS